MYLQLEVSVSSEFTSERGRWTLQRWGHGRHGMRTERESAKYITLRPGSCLHTILIKGSSRIPRPTREIVDNGRSHVNPMTEVQFTKRSGQLAQSAFGCSLAPGHIVAH